ncbi:MAG: indolepyruvate ferredoxin oxidoreductase family protein [Hyphomicrobiales bacterium]|nr:indolepyruvate ferredoxin oxidoreductase family protein [Hyphomicrobiales bacterium]
MDADAVSLGDKYDLAKRRILLTGSQAVVRLALMQYARDRRMGKQTAGYVTGYRGSPLGALDQQFARASNILADTDIVFQPAVNEDLAATALWGAQQAEMRGEGRFDGVFGIWYGKGPGADRSGDALKHANLAGTSPWGGVLALMGDDHTCESSTTAHQSEYAFVDAMIPILSPAGVQEILDYGLFGIAMSRFTGVWVGLKCVKDTVESTATVDGSLDRQSTVIPGGFTMPPGGLSIRPGDPPVAQEERLHESKLPAVLAFLRANVPDRLVLAGGRAPRIGVITAGKSYLDVLQALDDLGIDEARAAAHGLKLLKLACTWPLEPSTIRRFAVQLDMIVVVEEKRGLIEAQVKEILYGGRVVPTVVGKRDEEGRWLLPSKGALDSNQIAIAIGDRILTGNFDAQLEHSLGRIKAAQERLAAGRDVATRGYYFCAGCPYNSGTTVPEGSRAYAGIGCHYMVQRMDRATEGYTQMGAEGANWVGEAPFSQRGHVFQNIGDGTYNHSGSLAIRAAAIAGVDITYRIYVNDAVALTGGQKVDGEMGVAEIAAQVRAEGANRIVVVSEDPKRYPKVGRWRTGVDIRHRDELESVQQGLAKVGGLSVLIYDQTCAAEKRRRRKRGKLPDPDCRVVINSLVCEGCGDCGVQSNCVAIAPLETEFGRKRTIDQSACNKDLSCLKGFCPSFVTVHGARPHQRDTTITFDLPDPVAPELDGDYAILITGVGGTGVVTIGALIAMAAHIEGKGVGVIDMAGLAQKGGPVTSHVRIAARPSGIKAIRVAAGGADILLACDMVVAGTARSLAAIEPGRTRAFVNTHETYPGEFTHDPDFTLPAERLIEAISSRAGEPQTVAIEATRIATALTGDAIATNMFMLGLAYQSGAIPLAAEALEQAITLNGVDVAMNKAAFAWGRRAAVAPDEVTAAADRLVGKAPTADGHDLDQIVDRRAAFLTNYQNQTYAQRYASAVNAIRVKEGRVAPGREDLSTAVARNLFKLMAIKDEYEVARLYTDGSFERELLAAFAGWDKLEFHLAPPLLSRRDPRSGRLRKSRYGAWMMGGFRLLAGLKVLRGTALDPFRFSPDRRLERRLLVEYEETLSLIGERLTPANYPASIALAGYPESIRGFGHVKHASVEQVAPEIIRQRAAFLAEGEKIRQAAE